jgi:glycosyltransferase involved in cell wall biosynthesis
MGKWSPGKVIRTLGIYSRLKLLILRYRPSVVIIPVSQSSTGYLKDSLYLLIAKTLFRKAVLHLRGSDFRNWYEGAGPLMRQWVRVTLGRADGIIVQGERLRTLFDGLVAPERIHVVPNGADFPMKPAFQRHTPFTVLYLANLQSSKGIEDVLEAVLLLKNQGIGEFRLNVAGAWRSPETQRNCMEFVKRHALPVTFLPAAVDGEKFRLLEAADAFVFTPRAPEGHPWVIVEAQAAGLPVIATAKGAIPEAVQDGENGFIVPDRDPAVIAERLQLLMEDEDLRQRVAKASRAAYASRYTEAAMVENMRKAIEAVRSK